MHRAHDIYKRQGDDENALILKHGALIDRLARRIAAKVGNMTLVDDLWSAGALGLVDAARRFDAAAGTQFQTFVQHRIRGAMVDELRRLDHLPRRLRADVNKVAKARQGLAQELGRAADDSEVAARLGISEQEVRETENVAAPPMPLHPEIVRTLQLESTEDQALRAERSRRLAAAIGKLPKRIQTLLSLHYVEGLTYSEVAQVLEVSQPRVSQLHSDAISKLRDALRADDAEEAA